MALTGIRDLSLINTPPAARQPILTYVGEFEEAAVVEALRRELLREGQAFFVHNWVQNIEAVAARLRELVPEARVAVAHGQMDEGTLEQVVLDFWEKRFDVLVCTTIIESGIDMPTVNTLVVDRADRLGLGQLHQLRGRVGRAGQRAYAYLLHPADRVLSRGGLRAVADHRRADRAGCGVQDRHARPRDPRRGQPARAGPVGPHRRGGLRPVRAARGRGRGRDEGRAAAAPGRSQHRRPLRRAPARRLRGPRGPAPRGVPAPGVGHRPRPRWTTSAPSGSTASAPLPAPAEGLLAVARLRVECLRTGVREVSATPARARPGGGPSRSARARGPHRARSSCPASARVRLRRLRPEAVVKEESRQVVVPLGPDERPVEALTDLLADLVPVSGALAGAESSGAGARR